MSRKRWAFAAGVAALVASAAVGVASATGNGAPSGAHYTLNIIGVDNPKNLNPNWASGNRIFVPLTGSAKILLTEGDYAVLDANGTDGEAKFQLPNPDADNTGTTLYSVFARALGKPGGSATVTLCAEDPADGSLVCNTGDLVVTLNRNASKPTFTNVSKELLYLWDVDLDGDGTVDLTRVPLFSDLLEGYFWQYDNNGLRIAQLRFYPCSTDVGATSGDPINDAACFTR